MRTYSQHPFFLGQETLDFGKEFNTLPPKQKGHFFLARWQEQVHPFSRYETILQSYTPEIVFRQVRLGYVRYVANNNLWTVHDYLLVLDDLLNRGILPTYTELELNYQRLFNNKGLRSRRDVK